MIGSTNLLMAGDNGYNLTRSLRFRASASAYLSRTPASATNQRTFTWSGWLKRGALGSLMQLLSAGTTSPASNFVLYFNGSGGGSSATDAFEIYSQVGGTANAYYTSNEVKRDPAAYFHVVLAVDTTQATPGLRISLWTNNQQVTLTGVTVPAQNTIFAVNAVVPHKIGASAGTTQYFDGYIAEVNFIDGQALTPSSFGSYNSTTGVWQPARYTGTYGTNGFYLPFTDNSALTTSSNVGLGKDFSGNGNYWTTNNISLTAGVTYDSMTDVPTLTSSTAANFCTLNPLRNNTIVLSNANLYVTSPSNTGGSTGTIAVNSGSWYWEVYCVSNGTNTANGVPHIGIIASDESSLVGSATNMYLYRSNGQIYSNGSYSQTGLATYTSGDVIGVAYNASSNSLQFYKNGTAVGTAVTTTLGKMYQPYWLVSYVNTNSIASFNFGQQPFAYTPPTGFVALNTYNLPDSTIKQGNKVMDATLYTGNGSTQTITNAAGFKPDLVWQKARAEVAGHRLVDSVRGATKVLYSSGSGAEATTSGVVDSFNSNGFTGGGSDVVTSGLSSVAWQWQAGQGSSSSNTSGTITSTVSVNASAGFSIVTYTGNGTAGATVGHGLGVAPPFIIIKNRTGASNWIVMGSFLGVNKYLLLQTTNAAATGSPGYDNGTLATSSVFSLSAGTDVNGSPTSYVAYCWSEIAGFSKFGKYPGNANADGWFEYLGFKPKFLMTKRTDSTSSWVIIDAGRNLFNVTNARLYPESSYGEDTADTMADFLSNGFKIRTSNPTENASGGTYIYAAFAENPFKNSLAR